MKRGDVGGERPLRPSLGGLKSEAASKGAASDVSPPDESATEFENPFLMQAIAEAHEDGLIGIQRNDKWIEERQHEIYQEEIQKGIKGEDEDLLKNVNRFFKGENLVRVYQKALDGKLGPIMQEKVRDFEQERHGTNISAIESAITADRLTRPIDDTIKDQVDKQVAIKNKELEVKSLEERRASTEATLCFMKAIPFCIMIPVVGMLPGEWKMLQIVPVLGVVWANWRPMIKLHKIMKEIKKQQKTIKPEDFDD